MGQLGEWNYNHLRRRANQSVSFSVPNKTPVTTQHRQGHPKVGF